MRILTCSKLLRISLLLFFFNIITIDAGNPVRAKKGMVVSANDLATEIGVQILRKGGNAIDAAVAVGFALAVTYPTAGNIGGGGFMVIHLADGKSTTIDFREVAPLAAHSKMYLDSLGNYDPKLSQKGWLSAGVPGTVAGLLYALDKYGTMRIKDVIQPSIDLAENGIMLNYYLAESINAYYDELRSIESSCKIFTNKGEKFQENDLLIQKDLANTLRLIRDNGVDEFYKGVITKKFIEESQKNGGIFTLQDFENYRVAERKPVEGTYRDYKIISMGPPSSGGICLLQALNALENFNFTKEEWGSSRYYHILIETLKRVFADRSAHLGDSDFYPVPTDFLTSKKYAKDIANSITDTATPSSNVSPTNLQYHESEETTHYSVVDEFGNAISTTYTINSAYGNRIVVDGLGFLLNNEMDDFSAKPGEPNQYGLVGSMANSIQPKKRMLSSMTPTIILKDGKPFMVIGSPGGSTIITQVLQTILNVIDFGMNIYDAIDAPRVHHQWLPDEIYYEQFGMPMDVKQNLINKGHIFGKSKSLGLLEGIIIDNETNTFYGTSDPRGNGTAGGF